MVFDFAPQHAPVSPFPVFIRVLVTCMRLNVINLLSRERDVNWGEHGKLGNLARMI